MLGNYTDDVTLLGTALQVGLGLAGLDLPADIRDLTYDLTYWEWSPEHVGQTLLTRNDKSKGGCGILAFEAAPGNEGRGRQRKMDH